MKFLRICAATLAAACLICGCATRPIIVGQVRPPINPEAVRVYRAPPQHFERIAIIDSPAGTSWIFPDRPSMDLGISRLRDQRLRWRERDFTGARLRRPGWRFGSRWFRF
jgi:hypothetical protein